jgi:PAS domain S-box-containing protein
VTTRKNAGDKNAGGNAVLPMLIFNPEQYEFTLHALAVLVVGAGIFCLGSFVLVRERWSRMGVRFWLFTTTLSVWLVLFGMAYASTDESTAFRWFQMGEMGVVFIPTALFFLAVSIVQREHELRYALWLCIVVSVLLGASVFTTGIMIRGLYRYPWGWYPRYGLMGHFFTTFFFVVGLFIVILFSQAYRRSTHPRNRERLRWILSSLGIGYLASVDFAASLGIPVYPFGYLSSGVFLVLMTRMIIQYRLMDIRAELATGQILETMQGAVVVVDLEGKIRLVNRIAQEMLGYCKADLLGRDLTTILPVPPAMSDAVSAGERLDSCEMVWSGSGGRRFDVSVAASAITDGRHDAPVGIVYVAHDITRRKQAEEGLKRFSEELQEANKRLETVDKLKSDFVSIVSHEIRTPLTSIKAFAELLLLKPAMPPERKTKLLRMVNDESDRLGRLINDLLDLSRMEAGSVWHYQPVSLRDVIQSSLDGIAPLAQNKGLLVTTALDGSLPAIIGDPDRLLQVVTNLLSNAVKFTPEGGTITVAAHAEEEPRPQIVLTVSDTGEGIPAEDLPHIFEKFHRARADTLKKIDGTGLGLTITHQIVEHHGGSIRVVSTPGVGSAFTVTLPRDHFEPRTG